MGGCRTAKSGVLPLLCTLVLLLSTALRLDGVDGYRSGGSVASRVERPRSRTSLLETKGSQSAASDPLRINCGGPGLIDEEGNRWMEDSFFLGGHAKTIPPAAAEGHMLRTVEATLRYFLPGEVSCYAIQRPPGRYFIRIAFAYLNVDGRKTPPVIRVYVEGVLVEVVHLGEKEGRAGGGEGAGEGAGGGAYYAEYVASVSDGDVDVCLLPRKGRPLVNSLQVLPQGGGAAAAEEASGKERAGGPETFLSTHVRINSGSGALGPPEDKGFRTWAADSSFSEGVDARITTNRSIRGTDQPPDRLPERLFQTAREAGHGKFTSYSWLLSGLSDLHEWLVRLYFAEINEAVRLGERVFDVQVNGLKLQGVDILERTGNVSFAPTVISLLVNVTLPSYSSPSNVIVSLASAAGSKYNPLISAIEIFEVIPSGTAREDVEAELEGLGAGSSSSTGMFLGSSPNGGGLPAAHVAAIVIGAMGVTVVVFVGAVFLLLWRSQHQQEVGQDRPNWEEGQPGSPESRILEEQVALRAMAGHRGMDSSGSRVERTDSRTRLIGSDRGEISASAEARRPRPRLEGLPDRSL